MAKRKKPPMPRKGWKWDDVIDARRESLAPTESMECDRCDRTGLRFAHRLKHERWETTCVCGACADAMEGTSDAEHREVNAAKLTQWLNLWDFSAKGTPRFRDGSLTVVVFPVDEYYKYRVFDDHGPPIARDESYFDTLEEAKIAVYERLGSLKARRM